MTDPGADTPTAAQLLALRPRVLELAHEAGEAVMAVYQRGFEVSEKADASPLTEADLASQRVLAHGLAELAPQWPILSEEARQTPFEERRHWPVSWLVDPLDGTKEFIKRNGEFTINIALIAGGRPVLGVVYAPALDVGYSAVAADGQGGAWRHEGQESTPIRVAPPVPPGKTLRVVVSRSHANDATRELLEQLGRNYRLEALGKGSALKICLVAEGAADFYPRLGPTMEWDTAAAHCVVEQAGGQLLTLAGEPLRYNRAELRNPAFVVTSDPSAPYLGYDALNAYAARTQP